MAKMSDDRLLAVIDNRIAGSVGYLEGGDGLAAARRKAMKYYRGDPFGNEKAGRSKIIMRLVAEKVDGMMPGLLKPFVSGEEIGRFDPEGPEDEAAAEQETDACNFVLLRQNPGFRILYVWFKDALLQRNSVVKVWWDKSEDVTFERYTGLEDTEFYLLAGEDDVELVEHDERIDAATGAKLHDVKIKLTNRVGHIEIRNVPPEEFLIESQSVSLEDATFVSHRVRKTVSDLVAMGFKKSDIEPYAGDSIVQISSERTERFSTDESVDLGDLDDGMDDPAMREVWLHECYVKVDYDGDDIAEWRKVLKIGDTGGKILENEEADGNPFADLTPILMPHKWVGESVADQTMDLQFNQSTFVRSAADHLYLSTMPVLGVVEGRANLDDILNRRPGGVVRMKEQGVVQAIPVTPLGPEVWQMIEFLETKAEQRTGMTRYNQGLQADTLNKTATGASLITNAGEQRLELTARTFAETGVKKLFLKIHALLKKHQTKAMILKLRNRWVPVNPTEWRTRRNMSISVGIGTGNKEQQMARMMNLLTVDAEIIKLQGGIQGPILTASNIYNKLKRLAEAAGLKDVEPYYTDPSTSKPPPPKPDPKMIEVQGKLAAKQAEMQFDAQAAVQKMQQEMTLAQQKMAGEMQLKMMDVANDMKVAFAKIAADLKAEIFETRVKAVAGAFTPAPTSGGGA